MIRELKIKNIKCFNELNIELEALNVLAGINSMGKSTVIQSLLLLRQAYEMNAIDKGIHLNGDVVTIGSGRDFMNRNSNEDCVTMELLVNNKRIFWKYEYDGSSDYQKIKETNITMQDISGINLFKSSFSYISAERLGPQRFYIQSYHKVFEKNEVGSKGELFADYLSERGLTDKVTNKMVLHSNCDSDFLIYQTEAWLSEISPGIHISPKKYQEAGIIGMEYKVFAEKYSPINIGFGISYVAPIVVSLLKATKGDMIILENPEAHLHPKGQRKMGELIAKAAAGGVQIIVETHSDHLLNGIRLAVKNKILSKINVRLNYFYQEIQEDKKIGRQVIHKKVSPAILDDGRLSSWPEGFFDEWDKALDELF